MVENHCGKDKRQVGKRNLFKAYNNSFTCDHYGNQDISKVNVPPKQQEPKVHARKQNRRNESYQLSQKIKPPTKKIDKKLNQLQKKESLSPKITVGSSFLESTSKFPREKPLFKCLRSLHYHPLLL